MADAPGTYATGWTANTIAAATNLKDNRLGSRAGFAMDATSGTLSKPDANPADAVGALLPFLVANAAANLPTGGISSSGVTPLQARILNMLYGDAGYLAAPALTASAVQPGAYFALSSNSAFQDPRFGKGYKGVADSVANAQNVYNEFAYQQLKREQSAKNAYYEAANNYNPYSGTPIGTAPLSADVLWKDVQRRKAGDDTERLLNTRYSTVGSGWNSYNTAF